MPSFSHIVFVGRSSLAAQSIDKESAIGAHCRGFDPLQHCKHMAPDLFAAPILPTEATSVRQGLNLDTSLHSILQILSVNPFEKVPLLQLLTDIAPEQETAPDANQLILF